MPESYVEVEMEAFNVFPQGRCYFVGCIRWTGNRNHHIGFSMSRTESLEYLALIGEDARWLNQHDGGPHGADFLKLDCTKLKTVFGMETLLECENGDGKDYGVDAGLF